MAVMWRRGSIILPINYENQSALLTQVATALLTLPTGWAVV